METWEGLRNYPIQAEFNRRYHPEGYDFKNGFNRYVESIPPYGGKNLRQVVETLLRDRRNISVLDLGCGAGNALLDMRLKYFGNVHGHGITASEFRSPLMKVLQDLLGINIIVGDAHEMESKFNKESFDLIFSFFGLEYMDPEVVLPQAVDLLSSGGVAMLTGTSFLNAHLKPRLVNIESNHNSISFTKK
ncbi:hypothetical protein A3H80_02975 [Candidatus Roizmanbacteria bacterium RIFCSPLOWO2_02_FULL_37_19]|uniref:Methyltransferase type 11 domain-containing protein n=1 Tax=Candidatus Roizmanbacteria bacterium RIFCSPHIGHO2_02_FULL_37_24 TaxID=1802037 RepID=A0A1F7GZN7_9BACT|nr:MAG: hypothetical protein A2862_03790 [Candidatus Roizmanbacteria bacterium RIFCSPHIGHO2_01_FULL_38_41]OGK24285.1 MAG: hypothetical protein A3C24_04270 [Candidatus Roizmanbacteria bacterium RIFCSPHIGHO2_02_FULL_37_24]OGK32159.1 MAG: hypothetical protein A3E10_03485 [Candidatus Roizmanbacteria bacterium RIFCSPHIGHO2_12_FULL_37_23]OGK43835.1 MAG: hypothetical protein A2956_04930 [Candidatus Roizmanbacteria bacterium RIFCSPLOWO2_01_FULL_37_57]OGK53822.1 MAG: hypothetical protein A3H80_02975 [Ca